jgi:hypothetical protein
MEKSFKDKMSLGFIYISNLFLTLAFRVTCSPLGLKKYPSLPRVGVWGVDERLAWFST